MEIKNFEIGEDLIKFVGGVFTLELNGKAEDLPFSVTIGSFKVTGTSDNKSGKYLVGYDEEGLKQRIPVEYITSYIQRK